MFDREAAADIDGIQFGADLLQLAVQVDHFIQLAPVINIILDAFIQEQVQHLQVVAVFIPFNFIYLKFQDVFCAYA